MDHAWGYGSEQRLREENQDSFGVFEFPDYTLAIVCDGMGGHVGGAQASSLAVRTIHDALRELSTKPLKEALEAALQRANLVIYEAARKNHRLMGMGTTVVCAAIRGRQCVVAHVGDSRGYRIRNGQVAPLTRDHTMVNLFVDAELLTPEDAATHPEAHVLSRSLGVERQVDVEVSEPFDLAQDDIIFLCSDGIHGVVTDWELANVDWRAPNEAVRRVLDLVVQREGDDNATGVAVMLGTSFEDVPPTPVPDPKRLDESSALSSALTAVPADDDTFDSTPSYRRTPDSGGSSYVVYEDHPIIDEKTVPTSPSPQHAAPAPAPIAAPPPPVAAAAAPAQAVPPPAAPRKGRSPVIPVLVGAAALTFAAIGLVLVLMPTDGDAGPTDEPVATVKVDGPSEAPPADPPAPAAAAEPEAPPPAATATLFAPELPPAPRRLPHRSTRYTQPPPGGQIQWIAVQAARNKECAKSLDEVQRGMDTSIDYARLYNQAWLCFVDAHERPLEQAKVEDWQDFRYILPHFEGTPELLAAAVDADAELKNVPSWYRPAVDGIEFRLERYASSTDDDKMVDVLNDSFGEPTVADHLAKDLHLTALAAAGLARVEQPSEEVQTWWARRVYVASRALNGRVGRTIERHRSELIPVIRQLLEEATSPRPLAGGGTSAVPAVVLQAYDVGLGKAPPPTLKVEKKVEYVPPKEPSLDDLDDRDDPARIHRAGGN